MPPGTSSRVGGTDSHRSAAAAGNQPPGKRSREGRGEACEQHVGQILRQGKAGCPSSPPKARAMGLPAQGTPIPPHHHHKAFCLVPSLGR